MSLHYTIAKALLDIYIQPANKMIEYKARQLNTLLETDRFTMTDEDQKKHNRRIEILAREIEVVNNLVNATDHALVALVEDYEKFKQADIQTHLKLKETTEMEQMWQTLALKYFTQANSKQI